MEVTLDDAILLDVKENNFKGRDGSMISFVQARVLDKNNDVQKVSVSKDYDWAGEDFKTLRRVSCVVTIEVTEEDFNGKQRLRKRLISIE